MPSFEEHINQVKKNIKFLERANKILDSWDWQVTVCFYVGVHLINAHISKKAELHYRTHKDVENAINPHNKLSIAKLPNEAYLAYLKLQNLSRRSRYLVSEKDSKSDQKAHLTYSKHLAKSIRHLQTVLSYCTKEYNIEIDKIKLKCDELRKDLLDHFDIA